MSSYLMLEKLLCKWVTPVIGNSLVLKIQWQREDSQGSSVSWWPSLWVVGILSFVLQKHNYTYWSGITEISGCVSAESLRPAIDVNILKANYVLKECGGLLKCGHWEHSEASEQNPQRKKKWLYFLHMLSKANFDK